MELFLEILRNNEIAQNYEIAGNKEMHKYKDILQNLREIDFAHQRKNIEISYNFYSKRKKIFARFSCKKFRLETLDSLDKLKSQCLSILQEWI